MRIDGFRPAGDVPLYLAAADVGVVPNRAAPRISSHYTSPLKVFEALASGLPLVVSDLPSLRDVLDEGGTPVRARKYLVKFDASEKRNVRAIVATSSLDHANRR